MKTFFIIASLVVGLLSAAIPIPGTDVWWSQFVAIMGIGFICVAIHVARMSFAISLFFIYLVFSTIFIAKMDIMSILCLMQTGLCLLMAKYISTLDKCNRNIIIKALVGLLFFQVFWGAVQALNLDPIFKLSTNAKLSDTVGFNGSHNQYGLFLAALSPFAFNNIVLIALVFAAIVMSKTYSAYIAMAAAFIFYHRADKKVVALGLVATICLSFVFLFFVHKGLNEKFKERFDLWKLSISQVWQEKAVMKISPTVNKIITCNRWFGYGFGKFFQISPYTQEKVIQNNSKGQHRYEHAHNDYVELFFDCGIVGIFFFILVLLELFLKFSRSSGCHVNMLGSCLVAYAVCALSIYTVHTAFNGFLFCILIGLLYGCFNEEEKLETA